MRHTSSGGSSTDIYHPKKSKLPGLNRGLRSRKKTVTSLSKDDEPSQMLESKNDNNDHDENYDEFDLLHDMKDRSIRRKRTTSESGPRYLRSLSENTPQTPLGGLGAAAWTTTGSAISATASDASSVRQRHSQKVILAAKHRRHIHGKRRDYTSITDELELMIAASPPLELQSVTDAAEAALSPMPPPAIRIEKECLHDAEEADYELMETIIHKRLRRDSTNLHASFEDLHTRSIIDGSISNFDFGTPCPSPGHSPLPIRRQEAIQQVSAEDFLNLENEKKTTLDIRVIRRETAETDSQEMKTCMTSHPDEQDFDQGEQTTPEKGLDIDDDETKC